MLCGKVAQLIHRFIRASLLLQLFSAHPSLVETPDVLDGIKRNPAETPGVLALPGPNEQWTPLTRYFHPKLKLSASVNAIGSRNVNPVS